MKFLHICLTLLVAIGATGCDATPPSQAPSQAAAAEPGESPASEAAAPPAYACRRAAGAIVIDGRADEPSWADAEVIDAFGMPWSDDAPRDATRGTRARLLWDDEQLYFYAEMDDVDLYADVTERDGQTWNNDVFELFFKPDDERLGYYEFQVNAANTQLDAFLPSRGAGGFGRFRDDQAFDMETAVVLHGTLNNWRDQDEGWAVEGRIAWSGFEPTGGAPQASAVWKFALCRYDYSVEYTAAELSTHAPLQVRNFHRYEDYAPIEFVGE